MKSYEVVNGAGPGGRLRLRKVETGRVLAVLDEAQACQLWITLGSALGLGTESLTVKNVEKASSLKTLAKRAKRSTR
jgi:hypothetical protein